MSDDLDPDNEISNEELLMQFQQHAERIGHAAISWSFAHSIIFVIFGQLSKMTFENSHAVFFALKQDYQQREITIALAKSELSDAPKVRDQVVKAISHFNKLSAERNAIIHTIWTPPSKTERIKSQPYAKLYYAGYDQDDASDRIEAFDQRVSAAQEKLIKAFGQILQRDASRNKSS